MIFEDWYQQNTKEEDKSAIRKLMLNFAYTEGYYQGIEDIRTEMGLKQQFVPNVLLKECEKSYKGHDLFERKV